MKFYHRTSKYSGWYFAIIEKAKSQNRSKKDGYFENHHIHPRCFGGPNKKPNLVLLTAREHLVCHRLLIRMFYENTPEWCSMVFAFKRMIDYGVKHLGQRAPIIKSRHFEERRRLHGQAMRIRMTGKKHTAEAKAKMSRSKKGTTLDADHKASIAASLKAALSTPEQRAKISAERSTRRLTPEQRIKRAETVKQIWAKRALEKGPKPDVLPGRNTPEEKKALMKHLVSLSQKGKGPRYVPTEEQRKARAETMRLVWAKRKGLLVVPEVHEHGEAKAHHI